MRARPLRPFRSENEGGRKKITELVARAHGNVALAGECIEALFDRDNSDDEQRALKKAGARLIAEALRRVGGGEG